MRLNGLPAGHTTKLGEEKCVYDCVYINFLSTKVWVTKILLTLEGVWTKIFFPPTIMHHIMHTSQSTTQVNNFYTILNSIKQNLYCPLLDTVHKNTTVAPKPQFYCVNPTDLRRALAGAITQQELITHSVPLDQLFFFIFVTFS